MQEPAIGPEEYNRHPLLYEPRSLCEECGRTHKAIVCPDCKGHFPFMRWVPIGVLDVGGEEEL